MSEKIPVFHATDSYIANHIARHKVNLYHAYFKGYPTANLAGHISYAEGFLSSGGLILQYSVPKNELMKCDEVDTQEEGAIPSDWYTSTLELPNDKWTHVPYAYREKMRNAGLIKELDDVDSWPRNLVISYLPHAYLEAVRKSTFQFFR